MVQKVREHTGFGKKEVAGSFYEKELQKTSQEKFRIEKVLKQKGNNLYAKWKGFDNSLKN